MNWILIVLLLIVLILIIKVLYLRNKIKHIRNKLAYVSELLYTTLNHEEYSVNKRNKNIINTEYHIKPYKYIVENFHKFNDAFNYDKYYSNKKNKDIPDIW